MSKKLPRNKQTWVQLTSEFVKEWPEVLEGIIYTNLPIHYVMYCDIVLKNNITIHYDVAKEIDDKKSEQLVADTLKKFINNNYNSIKFVDLKFDIPKLKTDMQSKTNILLGKTFK
jgi:hypothetical protein